MAIQPVLIYKNLHTIYVDWIDFPAAEVFESQNFVTNYLKVLEPYFKQISC